MNRSRVRCRRRNNNLLRTPGLRKDLLSTDRALGISNIATRVVEGVPLTAKATDCHVASTSELDQNLEINSVEREGSKRCITQARKSKNLKFKNGIRIRTFQSLKRIKSGASVQSMLGRRPPVLDTSDSPLSMTEKTFAIKDENQSLLEFVSPAPDLLPGCGTFSLKQDLCSPSLKLGLNTKFPSHFEETVIEGFSVLAFNSAGDMLLYSRMAGAEMLAKDAASVAATAAAACSLENGGTSAATSDRPSRRSRAAALASAVTAAAVGGGGGCGGGASRPTGPGNKRALSSLPAFGLDQAAASKMDELQDLTTVGGHSSSLLQPLSIDTDDFVRDITATPEALLSDRSCHVLAFRQSQSENGDTHGSPKAAAVAAAALSLSSSSASPSSSSMAATNHVTPTDTLPGGFSKHEVTSVCDRVRRSCPFTGSDTSPPDLSPVHPPPLPSQHRQRTPKTARSTPNHKIRWSQGKTAARDEDPFVTASGSCFSGLNYSRAPPGVASSAPLLSPVGLSPSKSNSSNVIAADKAIAALRVKVEEGGTAGEPTKSSVSVDELAADNADPVLTKSMSRFSIAVLTGDDSACSKLDPAALPAVTSVSSSSFVRPVVSATPPKRTPHQAAKKGLGTPISPSSSCKRSPNTCKSRVNHRSSDVKPSLPLSNGATGPYDTVYHPPMSSPSCSSSSGTVGFGAFPLRQSSEWFSKLSRLSNTSSLSEEQVVEIAQHILYDPVFREGVTALPCFDDLSARLSLIWSRLFDPSRSCLPQSFEQFPLNAFNNPADLLAQLAYTKQPPENLPPPPLPFDGGGFPCRPPCIPLLTPLPNALPPPGALPFFSMGPPPPLHLPPFVPPQLNGRSYDELPAMPGLTPAPFRPGLTAGNSQPCASNVSAEPQTSVHSKHSVSSFTPMLSVSDSSQKTPWLPPTSEFLPSGWDAWESVLGSLSANCQIQRKLSNVPAGAVDLSVSPCQSVPSFGQLAPSNPHRSHSSINLEHGSSSSRSTKGPNSSGMLLPTEFKLPHLRDGPLPDQRNYQHLQPMPGSLAYMNRKHSPKQPSIPRFGNVLKLENNVTGNGSNAHVRIAFHIVRDKYASSFSMNSSKSRLPWFNNSRLPRPRATRPSGRAEKQTPVGNLPSVTSANFMPPPPLLPSPAAPDFSSPAQLSQFANPEEFMAKFLENMFSQLPAAAAAAAAFPNMVFNMAEMQEHFSRALDSNHVPRVTPNPVGFEGSVPGPPTPSSVIDLTRPERIPQMLFPSPAPAPPPPSFQSSSRPTASSQTASEKTRYSKARTPVCTNTIKRSCDPGLGLPSEASTRTSHSQPQRHGSSPTRFPTASAGMTFFKPPALEPARAPEGAANGASALELEAKRRRVHASDGPDFEFTATAAAAAAASRLRASPKDRRDWNLGHAGGSRNLPPPEPSSATMQSLVNAVSSCHRSHQHLNPL